MFYPKTSLWFSPPEIDESREMVREECTYFSSRPFFSANIYLSIDLRNMPTNDFLFSLPSIPPLPFRTPFQNPRIHTSWRVSECGRRRLSAQASATPQSCLVTLLDASEKSVISLQGFVWRTALGKSNKAFRAQPCHRRPCLRNTLSNQIIPVQVPWILKQLASLSFLFALQILAR
jgi:hypothetical protein